jgi:predicted nucleic acid-binding protein
VPDYLLDTNILIHWYDTSSPKHPNVLGHVNRVKSPDPHTDYVSRLFASVITLGEIEYGARASRAPDAAKAAEYAAMDAQKIKFVHEQCPEPLEITEHVAQWYGDLKAWLFDNCAPNVKRAKKKRVEELLSPTTGKELGIDENDLWIAAVAVTHGLVLVTHDSRGNFAAMLKQFAQVLTVEDWTT